jgi:hypothetical protein
MDQRRLSNLRVYRLTGNEFCYLDTVEVRDSSSLGPTIQFQAGVVNVRVGEVVVWPCASVLCTRYS